MHAPRPWYGPNRYVGLHYDLHANAADTVLGTRAAPELLVPMLRLMGPDWVQTDCKGHAGYTSWFSRVPDASAPAALTHDALEQWRAATAAMGLPLHCHYSGLWDSAAGKRHAAWAVKGPDGKAAGAPFGGRRGAATNDVMCPRGPYVEKLLIPQMKELVDRYGVDGFWVDGEIWAAKPCYCRRCKAAWTRETGRSEPPASPEEGGWAEWMAFTRRSFETYVTRYCEALHAHHPGVRVCSNWLQTFKDPGEPLIPTDWISGDNVWVFGLDQSRCEARFLSTRGKPWDIMLWGFYGSHGNGNPRSPMTFKPPQMLMQEAAVLAVFGGNVQIYEHPPVRDGRLSPWRQKRLGEVVRFIRARRSVCQGSETVPQVAVLHSEHHLHATISGPNLLWNVDTTPVEGAVYSLLENHYGVDVMDEWALLPRLDEFPVVVVPEQHAMSDTMAAELLRYLRSGGRVLLTGSACFDRFGADVIGAISVATEADRSYAIAAADGDVPVYSGEWRILEPTGGKPLRTLGEGSFLEGCETGRPAAVLNRVGGGRLLYVPGALFADFHRNRYPLMRSLVGELVRALAGRLPLEVSAPVCIDVAFRRKGRRLVVHLVNRSSGIPNAPNNGAIDEIPAVGPVTVSIALPEPPRRVERRLERGAVDWSFARGRVTVTIPSVHIHAAIALTLPAG